MDSDDEGLTRYPKLNTLRRRLMIHAKLNLENFNFRKRWVVDWPERLM